MKIPNLWITVLLVIFSILFSSCAKDNTAQEKIQPVQIEKIEGTDLNRVILTERANERLGIQTTLVSDQAVSRNWVVGGEIVLSKIPAVTITAPNTGIISIPADTVNPESGMGLTSGQVVLRLFPVIASVDGGGGAVDIKAPSNSTLLKMLVSQGQVVEKGQPLFQVANLEEIWVRVTVNESDLSNVDRDQPAYILSLEADDEEDSDQEGLEANALDDIEDDDPDEERVAIYYTIYGAEQSLSLGKRVLVELPLTGNSVTHLVVPYSAVIYDLEGNTWVYINPEPLVFIRQAVTIDYIHDDMAVLLEGPPAGTMVATVGVAELYGADTGVGK
jgi:multidrug efflux pump subunit AcrA (membrane-fusion protein)